MKGGHVAIRHTKGIATKMVAASDAPSDIKAIADYICDGTDDDVQIQAAIDAVAAKGGRVVLSTGKFVISSTIDLKAQLVFEGTGIGSGASAGEGTTIYLADGSDCTMLEFEKTAGGADADFLTIREIYLYGNNANNAATSHGVWIHGDADGTPMDIMIDHVWVHGFNNDGFRITSLNNTGNAWGVYMRSCLSETNGGYGLYAKMNQCYIVSGFYAYNGKSGLLFSSPTKAVTLLGVISRANKWHGFHASSCNNITFNGCIAYENSDDTVGGFDNFLIDNTTNFTMNGCISYDGANDYVDYGINVNNTGSSGTITGCTSHDVTTGLRVETQADVVLGANLVHSNDTDYEGIGGGIYTLSDGKVGIGTNAPSTKLDVAGAVKAEEVVVDNVSLDGDKVNFNSSATSYINATVADKDLRIQGNDGGTIRTGMSFDASEYMRPCAFSGIVVGEITYNADKHFDDSSHASAHVTMYIGDETIDVSVSDKRLKENIVDSVLNAVELIGRMKIKDFDWKPPKENKGRMTGLIAQDVYKYLPQYVSMPIEEKNEAGEDNMWSVKYNMMVPMLLKAVQELASKVEKLENR